MGKRNKKIIVTCEFVSKIYKKILWIITIFSFPTIVGAFAFPFDPPEYHGRPSQATIPYTHLPIVHKEEERSTRLALVITSALV